VGAKYLRTLDPVEYPRGILDRTEDGKIRETIESLYDRIKLYETFAEQEHRRQSHGLRPNTVHQRSSEMSFFRGILRNGPLNPFYFHDSKTDERPWNDQENSHRQAWSFLLGLSLALFFVLYKFERAGGKVQRGVTQKKKALEEPDPGTAALQLEEANAVLEEGIKEYEYLERNHLCSLKNIRFGSPLPPPTLPALPTERGMDETPLLAGGRPPLPAGDLRPRFCSAWPHTRRARLCGKR